MTICSSRTIKKALACSLSILVLAASHGPAPAAPEAKVGTPDIARYLAGLPVAGGSALEPATKGRVWQQHKKRLDTAWASVEARQLSKIRKWSEKNVTSPQQTLFYPFSGPDFLYANAFFPTAKTYVLAGLEPVGIEPDLGNLSQARRDAGIEALQSSMNTILRVSFFRTDEMMNKLRQRAFPGVIPVLYTFIARSGHAVEKSELLVFGADGMPQVTTDSKKPDGVRITFSAEGKDEKKVLYYFSTNIANDGLKKSGFLNFLKTLAPGDAFIKSASYLPHRAHFSDLREFLLANARHLVQDDTGIPLTFFDEAK